MEMDPKESKVVQWYKGKNVFITGASGFMGKVLVEKLLSSCSDIGNIYILMRSKRGRTVEQRVWDMWKTPMFQRLKDSNSSACKKIIAVHGDLYSENLGLTEADLTRITNTVSIVFHCAATLKLEATLKDAIEQNTAGTERVINVAKKIKNLLAFIHTSTAFCSADLDVFEEKVYESRDDPREVIAATRWMNDTALNNATKALIEPHPNTYTYSKRLAETLVVQEAGNMRVAIVRPSIVTPASHEPIEGWVDNLNGPMGLLVAGGKGVLRTMHCNGDLNAHVVPVDIAINAIILIAHKLGSALTKPKEIPVYNFTNDGVFKITWAEVLTIGKDVCHKYPFEQMVWYPDGSITSSYAVHKIRAIFMHWIPAYFIDFLMILFLQKRFMVRIQNKIHDGLELLQFFATRQWNFVSDNFLALNEDLDPIEQELFQMNFTKYPITEYMENCVLGARQYCMKEDPSTIPRCRIQQHVMYALHRIVSLLFYIGILYLLYHGSAMILGCVESYMK